ncbi:MAG TPA: hypothetical protein DHV29_09735 [Bacteroidales bacterium]|nr:hypothetical protein [Bacteroidales bacterium]HCB62635.1 hypothetical protein [Bacteroidales bacterium]HCY23755.1 hypothetical protein [Bacteroidales bacterium]
MLNIKECRELLKEKGKAYNDDQVQAIRDFLYNLARINVQYIKEKLRQNEQKGNIIHKSIDG